MVLSGFELGKLSVLTPSVPHSSKTSSRLKSKFPFNNSYGYQCLILTLSEMSPMVLDVVQGCTGQHGDVRGCMGLCRALRGRAGEGAERT